MQLRDRCKDSKTKRTVVEEGGQPIAEPAAIQKRVSGPHLRNESGLETPGGDQNNLKSPLFETDEGKRRGGKFHSGDRRETRLDA